MLNTARKIETIAALALGWLLVFGLPLRWGRHFYRTRLGQPVPADHGERPAGAAPRDAARALAVARRVARLSPAMPFRTSCLVRAVAGALLLRRRGLRATTIRFGVRKNAGVLEAHAWLIHDGVVVLGGEVHDSYVSLADLRVAGAKAERAPESKAL